MAVSTQQLISGLYVAFFNRAPDQSGLQFWTNAAVQSQLTDNALAREMAKGFATHPFFTSAYGALNNDQFIDTVYNNIGGAPADANGKSFWLKALDGGLSRSDFVGDYTFLLLNITVAELQAQLNSGAITQEDYDNAILRQDRLTNKSEVGLQFANALGANSNLAPGTNPNDPASLDNDPAFQASRAIIAGVTQDPDTKTGPADYLNGTPSVSGTLATFGTFGETNGLVDAPATTTQIRATFVSAEVGNGNANNAAGELAVALQQEDNADALIGAEIRVSDEGTTLTAKNGQTFDVRDVSGAQRGDKFTTVKLGTDAGEVVEAAATATYINAGAGSDVIVGGTGADFLVGNGGDDQISAGAGDSVIGGAGVDTVVVSGTRASYLVNDGTAAVTLTAQTGGTINLVKVGGVNSVENIRFSDGTVTVAELIAPPVLDKNFVLTPGTDAGAAFTGGAGNDTFNGTLVVGGTSDTLTAGDNLTGGSGTDTLSVTVSGSNNIAALSATPTLNGIEKVLVSNALSGTSRGVSIDLSLADSALTTVGTIASATSGVATSFTSVNNLVGAEMKGRGNLTVTFVDTAVAGTGTGGESMNLTLNGVGASDSSANFDANGIETLNITSSVAANFLVLGEDSSSDSFTKVTVAGDKALALNLSTGNSVTTIDANTASGALTLTNIKATNVSVTGGAGNDSFDFGAGFDASSGADSVNGGSGIDTLKITASGTVGDAAFTQATSVETLNITAGGSGVTLDAKAGAAGITTVTEATGNNSLNLTVGSGFTNALTVELSGTGGDTGDKVDAAAATVNLTVKSTLANLGANDTITGGSGTGTVDTLVLTAGGTGNATGVSHFETITFVANGASGGELTNIAVASGETLTIDAAALTNTGAAVKLDASGATGKLVVTGGAGNDTIFSGSGNDVIMGGDGNDSINAGAGNDSLMGGSGNDTFTFASGALSSGDTIDGGDGTGDTLVLANGETITSAMFTNVTNVENLQFVGSATLNANIPFTSFDLSPTGGQTLTLASGYTNATTVTVGDEAAGSGDKVTNTANVALTINATVSAMTTGNAEGNGTDAAATIEGGTGIDTLNLTASFDGTGATGSVLTLATATSIDVVNIIDRGDAASGDETAAGADVYLTLEAGYGNIKIDASALDAGTMSGATLINDEALNLNATGAVGKLTVIGGAGNDSIRAGQGVDDINGGDGNDTISLGANLTGDDTIAGGSGTDTLVVEQGAGGLGDLSFLQVTSIENLTVGTGAGTVTLDTRAQAAGINTITLNEGNGNRTVTAAGFTTALTFDATAATDGNLNLTAGTANDVFVFAGSGALNASDSLAGGSGTDTIRLDNGTGSNVTTAALGSGVTGIEMVVVNDTSTGSSSAAGADVDLTLAAAFGSGQSTITIDGSALDADETLSFTNSSTADTNATASGTQYLTVNVQGGAGKDTLNGGAGADTLVGNAGDDVIVGGAGADTLTGGSGKDVFKFASTDSAGAVLDTITDFVQGSDTLEISLNFSSATGAVTVKGSYVGAAASNIDGLSLLSSKAGEFFFNSTNKQLVMDSDGNGLIQATDTVINLSNAAGLANTDVAFNITGSTGDDNITGGGLADTITGGSGADQITTGAGADVIILAASGDSTTATVTSDMGVATIAEAAGDVVTGDVSDTFDIVAGGGTYAAVSAVTVLTDGAIATATYATTGLDVFVYKDGTDFYLAYETSAGSAGTFGDLETVKLVGIVDANDTFTVSAAGVVSFAAVANT